MTRFFDFVYKEYCYVHKTDREGRSVLLINPNECNHKQKVLVIIPKKPFYDWGNSLTPDIAPIKKYDECESYLLDHGWNSTQAENFLKANYDQFFQDQLFGTWTDKSGWPQKRTWEMFLEWFDWHFSSMVWDVFPEKEMQWEEW